MKDKPIDIARWYEEGTLGSFSMALMDLIGKADMENRLKLSLLFPEYMEAYDIWFRGEY